MGALVTWIGDRAVAIGAAVLAGLALLAALLSGARRAGRDAARADAAEASIDAARQSQAATARLRAGSDDAINAMLCRPEDRR